MRTITTIAYKFSELSEEAKENALKHLSGINVDHGSQWWESTYEDAKNIGLEITSFDLDRNRHATGDFTLSALEVAANILKEHGDKCETYTTAANFLDEHSPIFAAYMDEDGEQYESGELEDQLTKLEDQFLKSLLEDYSIMLQKECEYLQSEEAVIETIEANEWEFNENGKML